LVFAPRGFVFASLASAPYGYAIVVVRVGRFASDQRDLVARPIMFDA
jgi:hypothetical protein